MRIAFQTFRHRAHGIANLVLGLPIAAALKTAALAVQMLPTLDKAVRTHIGIVANLGFELHRSYSALRLTFGSFASKRRVVIEGAVEVTHCVRSNGFEFGSGTFPYLMLVRQNR